MRKSSGLSFSCSVWTFFILTRYVNIVCVQLWCQFESALSFNCAYPPFLCILLDLVSNSNFMEFEYLAFTSDFFRGIGDWVFGVWFQMPTLLFLYEL